MNCRIQRENKLNLKSENDCDRLIKDNENQKTMNMNLHDYINLKQSEALDSLRYTLSRISYKNLNTGNEDTGNPPLPDPSKMHELSTAADDEFQIVAMMIGLAEEWFRGGMVAANQVNQSNDLGDIFKERNLLILESLKNWLKGYR